MQLRISLASPEQMRQWSGGEVTQATTLHYRTHLPEPDGLFCQRIFGPVTDWTCACSPSVRARDREPVQRGTRCPRCGVLRGESRLRRERMGHLELAAPVAHPWFAHGSPSVLSLLLGLSQAHLETVLAYAGYLVLPTPEKERHHAPVETADALALQQAVGSYLDERTVRDLREQDREQQGFPACLGTGPEAVHTVLAHLDLPALAQEVRAALHDAPDEEQAKRLSKRLQVIEALRHSEIRPEWMILTVLPVLPPDLRPILVMDGNRIASADVNTLYERVLHRTQRIRQFEERGAPTLLLHQEKRALQHSVEALLDNGHSSHPVTNARRQRLKSLTDSLAGKRGRFRLNLLGKRVDYSGRSVIVGNPRLKLHQCGLPKIMACELFKPFVMRKLVDRHLARTLRHAKRLVERRDPVIWDQLAECLYERVVLLNRAPTLHRLSIQAFEPVLIEGKALQLHPQVCSSFNADFDGDQMAVHVPLSDAAQAEARALLLSTHNLRSPASGEPSITISQEQVLGLYYLTEERPSDKRAGRLFADPNEARLAYEQGIIDLHTPIVVRLPDAQVYDAPGTAHPLPARRGSHGRLATTVGRLLFNEALPPDLRYKNYAMTKDALKQLIAECLTCCGDETTAQLADALKTLGFSYATKSGISFAMSDIQMPPQREALIEEGQRRWNEVSDLLSSGEITNDEWYRQTITLWTEITDRIADTLKDVLPPFGTMMTIVKSGATKAKFQQIRQLSGIRGLLASPSGRIIPQPVLSNYLLGMLVWEIFIAARAARKGFMDRSLNTAPSGYLTRKLVEAGMPLWITMADCGTHEGLLVTAALDRRAGRADLRPLLVGRVLAEPVAHLPAGTLLTEQMVDVLLAQGMDGARIRSPLTCQAEVGLCQQCYGRDLATGKLVKRGVAVGVIAGQSIGEPGTQLTMRTFHSGGVANAQGDITQGMPRVSELFEARTPTHKALLARIAGRVKLDEAHPQHVTLVTETTLYDDYPLPPAATILVREQERVDVGQILAHSTHGAIQSRYAATVERVSEGSITLFTTERTEQSYTLPAGMQWIVQAGQQVEVGTPLSSGAIDPHELLSLCGVEAVARYLVSEVQAVYRTSGASVSDKHPETIVRQMLHCVRVVEEGDTDLIPGAIIPRTRFARETAAVLAQGGRPPVACPVLLGLIQTVLATESWVVAASFQQTARVLTQAALRGQLDPLVGLKENVMVGLPIPTPV